MSSLLSTLSEEALSESQQLAVELAATRALQDVSTQMIRGDDIEVLHERIMDAAVAIMRSDFASMQMLYPERGTGGELRLLAFRGFNPEAAKFWEWVRADSECSCGIALRTGKRVIVPDIENCDFMAGTEDQATYLQAGLLAVQSTPLVSRSGTLVGMISTHWKQPHQPVERELCLLDVLARQAADLIERKQAEAERDRAESQQLGQMQVLRLIASDAPLADTLEALIHMVEGHSRNGLIGSILLLDSDQTHLRHGAGPSLPDAYNRAIDGIAIGPVVGSCGTAAYLKEPVNVSDIEHDPLWADFRDLALSHNLRACWSTPIFSSRDVVLGTFAMYYRTAQRPHEDDQKLIEVVTRTASIAIERRQIEADRDRALAAAESERTRLKDLFMAAPAIICLLRGPLHTFELANPLYRRIIGRNDSKEIIGRPVREVVPEVEGQGYFELLDQVYATGEPFIGNESRAMLDRSGDGTLEEVFVNFVYQPTRDATGVVDGIFVHAVDVTEQVRARQAIAKSEKRLRFVMESMPHKLFTATPGGDVDYFNQQWVEFTGLSFEQIRDWGWTQFIHPDDVAENVRVWRHSIDTGEPFRFEHRFRGVDGEYHWHISRALPMRDGAGRIVMWIGSNTDIDDQKRAAAERESLLDSERAARSEAERTGRMKDEFLATLSHELRTPLNAILGYATLMNMAKMGDAEVKEAARTIERNARVQAQLIEDLLDMNRIISGKVRLEMQRLNVPDVIEEAVKTVRPSAEAKGVRLELLLDTCGVPVRGDPGRIQQIVWNLLSNAVKFTPRGGKVQVLLERVNSHIEIIVIDTGAGIPPDFLPYVFDRFRQADGSTTRRHAGLGLGLAIVKHLVELHGGTIRASSPGESQGATFTISLPVLAVIRPDDTAQKQHPKAPQAPFHFDGCDVDLSGVRVLVVDDEPDATHLVKRVLEECKAEVAEATSAEAAYALLSKARFDVLLSDIGMPGEDGYQLIRKVRTMPDGNKGIPAIALTAFARSEDRRRAALAGFQSHLSKPVEAPELLAIVANLAGKTGHASAEETSDV